MDMSTKRGFMVCRGLTAPAEERLLLSKLFDSRRFTAEPAQIEEFRSAYTAAPYHIYLLDAVGVEREDTLDTHVVGADLSNYKSFSGPLTANGDADTFEILYTGLFALFDVDGNPNRISGTKLRDTLVFNLRLFERLNISIFHHFPFG